MVRLNLEYGSAIFGENSCISVKKIPVFSCIFYDPRESTAFVLQNHNACAQLDSGCVLKPIANCYSPEPGGIVGLLS